MANECSGILDDWGVGNYRARGFLRAWMQLKVRFLVGLLFAPALTGCGGSGSSTAPASAGPSTAPYSAGSSPPPPAPLSAQAWQGHFIGTVKIGTGQYYGDALLTVDGMVRLYVGGPYASDGTVQLTRPDSSAQFVGTVEGQGNQAAGSGVIIGQGCAAPVPGRLCGETAAGDINIEVDSGNIQGNIHVTTHAGVEIWSLVLSEWNNYYVLPAKTENVAGQYKEVLAEFALDGDTIMSVDRTGQLSFQSVHSGCIGNGTLAAHLDGKFNVYDVALTIENCNAPYTYLNGGFEGLATTTPSDAWDYDSLLRTWLSKRESTSSQAAVTTLGDPM
jgi:hypothetical protein